MQETELVSLRLRQPFPVRPSGHEQFDGPHDVGLHEITRAVNGPVDVRLRREVDDRGRLVAVEKLRHQSTIPDVPPHEDVILAIVDFGERIEIAGVRELIQIDDAKTVGRQLPREATPNETGSASYQVDLGGGVLRHLRKSREALGVLGSCCRIP